MFLFLKPYPRVQGKLLFKISSMHPLPSVSISLTKYYATYVLSCKHSDFFIKTTLVQLNKGSTFLPCLKRM